MKEYEEAANTTTTSWKGFQSRLIKFTKQDEAIK